MQDEIEQLPSLSSTGVQRREAILSIAKRHASRRRARKAAARGVAAFAGAAGLGFLLWSSRSEPSPRPAPPPYIVSSDTIPAPTLPESGSPDPAPPYTHFNFALIQTNDAVVGVYTMRETSVPTVSTVSDDQLLDSLHRVGIDAGIAQMGSRSLMVLNDTFRQPTQ